MKSQLSDCVANLGVIQIKFNNTGTINLTKNLIFHSLMKHIKVRHNFIREYVEKWDCLIERVFAYNQLAYIFNKPLPKETFFP